MEDSLQDGIAEGSDVDMQALFPDQCSLHIKKQIISFDFKKNTGVSFNFTQEDKWETSTTQLKSSVKHKEYIKDREWQRHQFKIKNKIWINGIKEDLTPFGKEDNSLHKVRSLVTGSPRHGRFLYNND